MAIVSRDSCTSVYEYVSFRVEDREAVPDLFRAMADWLAELAEPWLVHGVEYHEINDEYNSEWHLVAQVYRGSGGVPS